jgi:hypothetical protein
VIDKIGEPCPSRGRCASLLANQPDLPIFASRQTSGVEVRAHLRRLMRHIRKNWPKTSILFRGDGHYARPEGMAWCETNGGFRHKHADQSDAPLNPFQVLPMPTFLSSCLNPARPAASPERLPNGA